MALGSNIALAMITVLVGNVWQRLHPVRVHPSASGWFLSRPHPAWAAIVNYYFFFPEHPGENCFQVWLEVKLSGARAPWEPHWVTKLLKYDYREDFVSTMLLCWDVTGFLPRSGRYGSACIHEISSFPFPPLPVHVVLRKEYRRKKKPQKQKTNNRDCFEINPKGWDELELD